MRNPTDVTPRHHSRPDQAPNTIEVSIDREVIVRLRPEAARRDTSVPQLITNLLNVIAADQLTTAILDD
jgi:hypothetical protein